MATEIKRIPVGPGLAGESSKWGLEHAYVNISSDDLNSGADLVPLLAGHTGVVDRVWVLLLAVEGVAIKIGSEFLFDGSTNSMTLPIGLHELPSPLYNDTAAEAITIAVSAGAVNINAYYHYEISG